MARFIAERTSQVSSVVSVQTRPANGGIGIQMELGYRPGQRSMVLLGDSLRERTSLAVAGSPDWTFIVSIYLLWGLRSNDFEERYPPR